MAKHTTKYKEKVGLPPGALIHIGKASDEKSKISLISYNDKHFEEKEVESLEECFSSDDAESVRWINIYGVHQTELIEEVGKKFGIHQLALADIVNTNHRPKIEDFDDYLFLILKMIFYDEKKGEIIAEQVSLIIGQNYVISFQENVGDLFDPVRNRLRGSSGRIRKMGADYLAYTLIDTVVDNYFVVLELMGEKIENIEDKLLSKPTPDSVKVIHSLKRDMIFLRRAVWPLREVTNFLERGESKLIQDSTQVFLRDVYDHIVQVIDTIESSRDMLAGMLDIYLSSVSNRLNSVMKVLTIIATIFMPLTFIAGVYGMNFRYMPELEWHLGYPAALFLMFSIGISMALYFKKMKWF